ncbi:hypothetical protein QQF64_007489 [Cirrhinus molitorella]|uniref:TRIM8/14/16/25/29/45/65 coiled-coil region domain-containing protein n=1 Tax=Cirrhinus molitorella TaxID=172907 RepID=A0ABR3MDY4_9TELE
MDDHKNHDTVSAAAQRTEKQKQLKKMQKTFQQRIQQREKDVQQLRETVESHKRSAQTAVEDSEKIFTELIRSIERSRSELIRLIRDQEKAAVSRAEGRLERLEQEINDLRRRDAELEQLSHTQDHIQFLQLRDKLEDFCKEELKKISDRVTFTNIVPRTRKDFLQYSHQLTLDLNTSLLTTLITEKHCQCEVNICCQFRFYYTYACSVKQPYNHHEAAEGDAEDVQQRIQQREKDVQQLRETVESHKTLAAYGSYCVFNLQHVTEDFVFSGSSRIVFACHYSLASGNQQLSTSSQLPLKSHIHLLLSMSPAGSAPGFLISHLALPASVVCFFEGFSVVELPIASLRYSAF